MHKQTVRDIEVAGKTVLVRVDYNVPIKDGRVGDTLRIESSFDTLRYLLNKNCKLVLISHLGRPDGQPNAALSLAPVAKKAAELLGKPIKFAPDCVGPQAESAVRALQSGEILLLENLRFHAEEEANDPDFAKQLAGPAEVYVDDAFAAIHRAHASTVGVTRHLPAVAGLLVEREYCTINQAMEAPERPLAAIIGGAKVSDKIEVLSRLIEKADSVFVGGAMANTFLAAAGQPIGKSIHEPDQLETARQIMDDAVAKKKELILPLDIVVADRVDQSGRPRQIDITEVGESEFIVDIGPRTVEKLTGILAGAKTIIWNGPVGISEIPQFADGTKGVAAAVIASPAKSIIGGGDTADYIDGQGLHDKFDFVSTGGGAALELMAGKKLPGIEVLLDK